MRRRRPTAPVIGRDLALQALASSWSRAASGDGGVLALVGEAGIGKTRLVDHLRGAAQGAGAHVAAAGCLPLLASAVPLSPIAQAWRTFLEFGAPLAADDERVLRDFVDGRYAAGEGSGMGHSRLFGALARHLEELCQGAPLLLVVEDLHWADLSSLALLHHLHSTGNRADHWPVLVAVTMRPDGTTGAKELLAELRRDRQVVLDLAPLGPPQAKMLGRELAGRHVSEGEADLLVARSGGNPFLLEELVTELTTGAPASARFVLSSRLDVLEPQARELARTLAVLGRPTDHSLLSVVSALPEEGLVTALRALVDEGVVVLSGSDYALRHALWQDVLLAEVLPSEGQRIHQLAGAALATRQAPAALVAGHLVLAGDAVAARHWTWSALDDAERAGGLNEALSWCRALLDLLGPGPGEPDRLQLLERQASLLSRLGRQDEEAQALRLLLERLHDGPPNRRAAVLARLAYALTGSGSLAAGHDVFLESLALLEGTDEDVDHAFVLATAAEGLLLTTAVDELRDLVRRAVEVARRSGRPLDLSRALAAQGMALMHESRLQEALVAFDRAVQILEEGDDPTELANVACSLTECLHRSGALEECLTRSQDAVGRVAAAGNPSHPVNAMLLHNAALSALKLGRLDEADRLCARILPLIADDGQGFQVLVLPFLLFYGRLDETEEILASYPQFNSHIPERARLYVECQTELLLARRHYRDAVACALRGLVRLTGTDQESCTGRLLLFSARGLADAHGSGGVPQELVELRAALQERSQVLRTGPLGPAAPPEIVTTAAVRLQWRAEQLRWDGQDTPDDWVQVAQAWGQLGRPHPQSGALVRAAAAAVRRPRGMTGAAVLLTQAESLVTRMRCGPLQEEIQALRKRARLRAAPGVPPQRREAASAPFGLTGREVEVLALLADGLTNAQIAQRLVISPNTVGIHVGHVLAKLGVSRRVQAAGIAHSLGLARLAPVHAEARPAR